MHCDWCGKGIVIPPDEPPPYVFINREPFIVCSERCIMEMRTDARRST